MHSEADIIDSISSGLDRTQHHITMSVDTSLLSFLSSHLLVQKKPITYRLLSREKNLHVSVAREALEKFHKENAGKELKATYVLQGTDADSGEGHILLVGEDRLEGE